MSRESMANYWIQKGFNNEAVEIFFYERTPEMTKIINNCRNTEEALAKINKKKEAQNEIQSGRITRQDR